MTGLRPRLQATYAYAMRYLTISCLLLCLAGCTDFRQFFPTEEAIAAPEGFPELLPLSGILASADQKTTQDDGAADLSERAERLNGQQLSGPGTGDLVTRAARLRTRADVLRGDASDLDKLRDDLLNI